MRIRAWPQRRVTRRALVAIAVALSSIVAASAGAHSYSQPDRVRTATTGDHSELVQTLDITATPGASPQVVMSLSSARLRKLQDEDRLNASSELEVTTDCVSQSPRCVGSPYDYDPIVDTQLVLAPDPSATSGTPLTGVSELTCRQSLPNRQHHCVAVFPGTAFDVSAGALACPPDACYVNLVASAHKPQALPGDKLIVGEDEPDGSIVQDKGRVNAVRLRPIAPGPEPHGKVKTYRTTDPEVGKLAIGDSSGLNKTVVFSQRLKNLRKGAQLAVNARVRNDISQLPYNVLVQSKLILATAARSTGPSALVKQVTTLKGELAEGNGTNCTQVDTPCLTRKVGVGRFVADSPRALYVNLVVGTKALRHTPDPGDKVKVAGGALKVVRYPASRRA
jgi:hypothetical protein